MGTLYENIMLLCERRGIKGGKMCTDTGISKGLLTDLKMGRRTGVSAVTAQKIANYFGVSVGYLLGEEEKEEKPTVIDDELSEYQRKIIDIAKNLSEADARLALQILQRFEDSDS